MTPWTWRNWLIFVLMFVAGVAISPPIALVTFLVWGIAKAYRTRHLDQDRS